MGLRKDGSDDFAIQAKLRLFDPHPSHANHHVGLVVCEKDGGWDFEGQLTLNVFAIFAFHRGFPVSVWWLKLLCLGTPEKILLTEG